MLLVPCKEVYNVKADESATLLRSLIPAPIPTMNTING
jgi:hypothetical protein